MHRGRVPAPLAHGVKQEHQPLNHLGLFKEIQYTPRGGAGSTADAGKSAFIAHCINHLGGIYAENQA